MPDSSHWNIVVVNPDGVRHEPIAARLAQLASDFDIQHTTAKAHQDNENADVFIILAEDASSIDLARVRSLASNPQTVVILLLNQPVPPGAERAALHAAEVRLAIPHTEVRAAGTTAFTVTTEAIPLLYDFFEQSMIGAVFSYLAIEAFANQVIARELTQSLEVDYHGRRQTLTPEQLERRLATREKLSQVLPVIRSVASPKGTALWERFTRLELARDSTVHLKVKDQYPKVKESLYFQMLTADATALPGIAAEMIRHYHRPNAEPRWLLRFLRSRDEVGEAARAKPASQSGGAPQL